MSESWVKLLRLADEMGSGEMSEKYAVELTRIRWERLEGKRGGGATKPLG